jgi:hypothetical protein
MNPIVTKSKARLNFRNWIKRRNRQLQLG